MKNNGKLNENFVLDLDAIKEFVFEELVQKEKSRDNEITETYGLDDDGKKKLISQVMHEVKGSDFSEHETLRYDMIKTFLTMLDSVELDTELAPMSFGQRLVLNTMVNYGLIKEING